MCGIVAYMGASEAKDILVGGLQRLEYRGYDSAGLAVMQQAVGSAPGDVAHDAKRRRSVSTSSSYHIKVVKTAGKVANLAKACESPDVAGSMGIAHTRWATHGPPTDRNAHPHVSSDGTLAIVHNGIVENFVALKAELKRKGYTMVSDTDTELIAHLISDVRKQQPMPVEEAVRQALTQVHGAFGLAVLSSDEPDRLIGARKGSPLILGIGEDECAPHRSQSLP